MEKKKTHIQREGPGGLYKYKMQLHLYSYILGCLQRQMERYTHRRAECGEKHLHGDSNGTHKALIFFPYAQKCMCSGVFFHIRQQSVSSQKAFGIRYLCSCQRTLLVLLLLMVLVLMLQCCYCRRRWWCGTVDAIRLLSLVLQSHC